ncbi:hypothetical protein ABIF78_007717 [Bradyrhizobium japonicum]
MRVCIGKALRVGPGDEVIIRGQLPASSRLSRLFVFAKEGAMEYSPYVKDIRIKMAVGGPPQLYSPLSMRLDTNRDSRELSFFVDFDGYIRVMQEVDTPKEARAKIRLKRIISPDLPWHQQFFRKIRGISAWIH